MAHGPGFKELRTGLAVAALAALAVMGCQPKAPTAVTPPPEAAQPAAPAPDAPGRLVYGRYSELWTVQPSTAQPQKMLSLGEQAFVGGPAASPDGRSIAFSLYRPGRTPQELGGSDLFVMPAAGGDRRQVLAHDAPGASLAEPAWTPDGAALYFTRRTTDGNVRIDRVGTDGAGRRTVVPNAHSPAISPDGARLVYLTTNPQTYAQTMWSAAPDGSGAKAIIPERDFTLMAMPRFSPDGKRIAFSAVGGPQGAPGPTPAPPGRTQRPWFEPPVAHAHGVPWELWVANADGSGIARLTAMNADTPVPAWSPDGRWIALAMEFGVYLIDLGGKPPHPLLDDFTTGGITWLPG